MPGTHPYIRWTKSLPLRCPSRSKETGLQDHYMRSHFLLAEVFISKALCLRSSSSSWWLLTWRGAGEHLGKGMPVTSASLQGLFCLLHVWMLSFPVCLYLHCWTCNQQEVCLSGDDCRIIFREVISSSAQLQTGRRGGKQAAGAVQQSRGVITVLTASSTLFGQPWHLLQGDYFMYGEDEFVSGQTVFTPWENLVFLFYWHANA